MRVSAFQILSRVAAALCGPSPLDILADAAINSTPTVAGGAAKSATRSALDASATAPVASPSPDFDVSLPDPYTDSDSSTVMIDDYADDVSMDSSICTLDGGFSDMNLDDGMYFDCPRPRRAAAKKSLARMAAKALSIGKENKPPVADTPVPRATTRRRRLSSASTSSSRTASSSTLGSPEKMGNDIMDVIEDAMEKAIDQARYSPRRRIVCDFADCRKEWSRSWDYKRHYLTHFKAVIGPIHCTHVGCNYQTIQNSNFERHVKKHLSRGVTYSAKEVKDWARRYRFVENKHY